MISTNDVFCSLPISAINRSVILPGAVLLVLAVASQIDAEAAACKQTTAIADLIKVGDPAGAAILIDSDCARALVEDGGREEAIILFDAGYPSALIGHFEPEDLMLALEQQVEQGDHESFGSDPALASVLQTFADESPDYAEQALRVRDFALASRSIKADWNESEVPSNTRRYAMFLPVWHNEAARAEFLKICVEIACEEPLATLDACDMQTMGVSKLAFARDPEAFLQKAETCDVSLQNVAFIQALRQYGIIDSSCSLAMQINVMANVGLKAAASCTNLLKTIGDHSSFSSADVVRYYRRVQSGEFILTKDDALKNAEAVALQSPAVAERLRSLGGVDGLPHVARGGFL